MTSDNCRKVAQAEAVVNVQGQYLLSLTTGAMDVMAKEEHTFHKVKNYPYGTWKRVAKEMGLLPNARNTWKYFVNRRIRKTVRTVVWEDGGGNSASDPIGIDEKSVEKPMQSKTNSSFCLSISWP